MVETVELFSHLYLDWWAKASKRLSSHCRGQGCSAVATIGPVPTPDIGGCLDHSRQGLSLLARMVEETQLPQQGWLSKVTKKFNRWLTVLESVTSRYGFEPDDLADRVLSEGMSVEEAVHYAR